MEKIMIIKGKLEMLANTIEIRKQTQTVKQDKTSTGPLLVYKDADEDEDE